MTASTLARPRTGPAPWSRLSGEIVDRPVRALRPVAPGAPVTQRPGGRPTRGVILRRRRLAAVAVLMALAFAAGILLAITLTSSPAGGSLTDRARQAQQVTYRIQPGDTLWQAAEHLAPGSDPREVVDALSAERGTTTVHPGEVLVWPPG